MLSTNSRRDYIGKAIVMETPTIEYPKKSAEQNAESTAESLFYNVLIKALKKLDGWLNGPSYEKAKLDLEIKYKNWGIISYVRTFVVFFLLWIVPCLNTENSVEELSLAGAITMCSAFSVISTSCYQLYWESSKKARQKIVFEYDLIHAQDEAQEDLFRNSIKTSYTYLDQYYAQTRKQAQQGFIITVSIAVCGAILIFGGVGFLLFGNSEKVTPAYITCASGAITEFISAVFFYLYNKTVTSMNSYHDKLVLSQNIAFALRVADSLSEEKKDDAKLAIISELVKDVNAQMMKSDADSDEQPPKKDKPSESETLTFTSIEVGNGTVTVTFEAEFVLEDEADTTEIPFGILYKTNLAAESNSKAADAALVTLDEPAQGEEYSTGTAVITLPQGVSNSFFLIGFDSATED